MSLTLLEQELFVEACATAMTKNALCLLFGCINFSLERRMRIIDA